MGGKELYSIEITTKAKFLDPNRIKGRDWRNVHARYEKIKRDICSLVSGKTPKKPLTNFTIKVLRRSGGTLDYDNLIASLKPFIDGIKIAGIIKDDNWSYIRHIQVDQEIAKMEKGFFELVMTIEELPKKSKKKVDPFDFILKRMKTFSEALMDENKEWVRDHLTQFVKVTEDYEK